MKFGTSVKIGRRRIKMLMTVEEAARLVGVSSSSLRKWVASGKLPEPRMTLGGHRRYDLEEVEEIKKLMAPRRK